MQSLNIVNDILNAIPILELHKIYKSINIIYDSFYYNIFKIQF